MILYVRNNEETSCLKIVHFVSDKKNEGFPPELEANRQSVFVFCGICLPNLMLVRCSS